MAPHNDAHSPSGSYTAGFNRFSYLTANGLPGLRLGGDVSGSGGSTPAESESASPLSSSFDSSAPVEVAGGGFGLQVGRQQQQRRRLTVGVYVPTMCFFDAETENVDAVTIARHAVRLARSGVTGLATQGSNGEAVHLTHSERQLVTQTTRSALNAAGFSHMPVIVGCGSQSTRETVELCVEAQRAGGDYALVLPPSYYAPLFAPACETVVRYFTAVADASPIPIIIYNYPGAVNGMDLSSDVIVRLSAHPNIVGVKLTCGNTGKLSRVVAATRGLPAKKSLSATAPAAAAAAAPAVGTTATGPATATVTTTASSDDDAPPFLVLAGSADFTLQSLVVGGHGMLAGLANIAPKACVKTVQLFRQGKLAEAQALQNTLSQGDWTAIQGGVVGVKAGLEAWSGYGGFCRSPLPKPTPAQRETWKEGFRNLVMLEKSL